MSETVSLYKLDVAKRSHLGVLSDVGCRRLPGHCIYCYVRFGGSEDPAGVVADISSGAGDENFLHLNNYF